MPTVNLTLTAHGPSWAEQISKMLDAFSRERRVTVKAETFSWNTIWGQLVDISIHQSGADVSAVGSTWVASLVSMNSLRPFQPTEIARMGGQEAFSPASWQSTMVIGSEKIWAIPFLSDVRVVYYWRDMLEQAGIDEDNAFSTPDAMQQTLERLQTIVPTPLVLQTISNNRETVYIAASWLWEAGSDFVSADGKSTLLNESTARKALQKHFQLARFLPGNELISPPMANEIFFERRAAVTISGPWFASSLWQSDNLPAWSSHLGVAAMPGPSFVGGVNLVIWQHSLLERETLQLIEYLTSPEVQNSLASSTTDLPATRAATQTLVQNKLHAQKFVNSIQHGRALPAIPLWGLTEQRLAGTFCRIWQELCETPDADVAQVLSKHLPILARKLDITLAG